MDALIHIDGEGRDELGGRYFRIALSDTVITVSAKTVVSDPGQLYTALTNAGVNCISPASKKVIIDQFQSFQEDEPSFRVASKIGHFHWQFVLPGRIIRMSVPRTVAVLDGLDQAMITKYR